MPFCFLDNFFSREGSREIKSVEVIFVKPNSGVYDYDEITFKRFFFRQVKSYKTLHFLSLTRKKKGKTNC